MTQKASASSFDFIGFQKEAVEKLKSGHSLTGEGGILTSLIKSIIEASLEAEMDQHMSLEEAGITNRRNGKSSKTVQTGSGPMELETPRDRAGSFSPNW